eukprot:TRINITY_DN8302_c0_g1_i1.p2 TRINITY_DN8302_c0_g1~~TRINITY_DN8302_c0_g1_i1.p2  ORF type:complete len:225 (-),score=60.71 TRINITY_DN8302_c0_g1_i1:62-736(-)
MCIRDSINAEYGVLSGNGVYDGSEVSETVSVLVHLSRHGAEAKCFAPDVQQMQVINHLSGQEVKGESRNVLVESARIARGDVTPLGSLRVEEFSAVIFPGGYGAAKNLSDFAIKGVDLQVEKETARVLKDFHAAKKPIGLCCISPVLAVKVFPGVKVTIGNDKEAAAAIKSLGGENIEKEADEALLDPSFLVVTSPAYMLPEAPLYKIFTGIGNMVDIVVKLAK